MEKRLTDLPRALGLAVLAWLMLAIYACARILEAIPDSVPLPVIVALDVLSSVAFALVHGARSYGWRGILAFAAICLIVGNTIENIGVATGIPFGRYYFAGLMGPKILHVPILLGTAYIGMAYVSWMLARLIVGESDAPTNVLRLFTLPLVASFILVAWDLAQDPIWGTVLHGWVWLDGGPWFGVPVSNYLGWLFTGFTIFFLFALLVGRRSQPRGTTHARWGAAIVFYAVCAGGNVLQRLPTPNPAVVADPTGTLWRIADITGASALVSIFGMGAFVTIACVRLIDSRGLPTD
jgi:putative membrane protein